jgi:DNA-directed RNA polymerase subunit E'/Rpb7
MAEITEMTCTIEVPPSALNTNLKTHIFTQLQKKFEKTCSKSHGHILRVVRIVSIKDNMISRTTSNILFNVVFEIERFIPTEGKRVEGVVQMVRPYGILFVCMDVKVFVASKDVPTLSPPPQVGDTYPLLLKSVQYKNREFNGIAIFAS